MKRILVVGDIHGAYKALIQVLERSNFDYNNDILIQLGDVCDGWNQVYECVEELLKIKNLIPIKGNHDDWFKEYLIKGIHPTRWLQGGDGTLISYTNYINNNENIIDRHINIIPSMGAYLTNLTTQDIPKSHVDFFINKQIPYYIDEENRCFVHGGFDRNFKIKDQNYIDLCWDRELFNKALCVSEYDVNLNTADNFTEIYIGHTSTVGWGTTKPMKAAQIWNLDTGAGWHGVLTIMDINTKEYWQSDPVKELYPDDKGRNK